MHSREDVENALDATAEELAKIPQRMSSIKRFT